MASVGCIELWRRLAPGGHSPGQEEASPSVCHHTLTGAHAIAHVCCVLPRAGHDVLSVHELCPQRTLMHGCGSRDMQRQFPELRQQ